MRHIAVIDPAVRTAELDCFNRLVCHSTLPLTHHLPGLFGTASLQASSEGLAGVIVLGSASSVHDNLSWQRELMVWLKLQIDAGTPTLGLCFGHQLIAYLYGGKVAYLNEEKQKRQGFHQITILKNRLWQAAQGLLFSSHREAVMTCPQEFHIIAKSETVPIEGLEHNHLPLWTLQPHPEATDTFLRNVNFSKRIEKDSFQFGHSLAKRFLDWVGNPKS